jgi:hypothetical protein
MYNYSSNEVLKTFDLCGESPKEIVGQLEQDERNKMIRKKVNALLGELQLFGESKDLFVPLQMPTSLNNKDSLMTWIKTYCENISTHDMEHFLKLNDMNSDLQKCLFDYNFRA